MKALYWASIFYLVLGLGAGVFYREFTRANDFPEGEFTQLSVAHTHLLSARFHDEPYLLGIGESLWSVAQPRSVQCVLLALQRRRGRHCWSHDLARMPDRTGGGVLCNGLWHRWSGTHPHHGRPNRIHRSAW